MLADSSFLVYSRVMYRVADPDPTSQDKPDSELDPDPTSQNKPGADPCIF